MEQPTQETMASNTLHGPIKDSNYPQSHSDGTSGGPPAMGYWLGDAGGDESGDDSVEELKGDELLQNLEAESQSAYTMLMRLQSR